MNVIPSNLRQKDGYWYALTKRARVIVYNKDKVNPAITYLHMML